MRLRSPAEYYIKSLLLCTENYSAEDIKERLIDEGLDFISIEYIDKLRAKLKPPDPFYPDDKRHAPSHRFLLKERVNRFFHPDVEMKLAQDILGIPRAKEFAESMILVHVPMTAIASHITASKSAFCTAPVLEIYRHYFWNIDLVDSSQMRVLLELRIDTAMANVPELKDKRKALQRAYYKDPRKVAADLPYSPMSATLTQLRLGVRPKRAEIAARLLEARDIAWVRAYEAAHQDGPGDSQKFLNYANGGRILEEILQVVVKPEDQLRTELSAIQLRTELQDVPHVHQLSAGNHTADLSPPLQTTPEDDADDDITFDTEGAGIDDGEADDGA